VVVVHLFFLSDFPQKRTHGQTVCFILRICTNDTDGNDDIPFGSIYFGITIAVLLYDFGAIFICHEVAECIVHSFVCGKKGTFFTCSQQPSFGRGVGYWGWRNLSVWLILGMSIM